MGLFTGWGEGLVSFGFSGFQVWLLIFVFFEHGSMSVLLFNLFPDSHLKNWPFVREFSTPVASIN